MDFLSRFQEILSIPRSTSNLKQEDKEEAAKRKKKCDCGYNPHDSDYDMTESCPVKLALRNHITFPPFYLMTEYHSPSTIYFDMTDVGFYPARHWAALFEIKNNISLARPGIVGWNQFGELVQVHFYHDNGLEPKTFQWSDFIPGNTLAILYPERKTFLDGNEGIREESLESCFVFKASLDKVQKEAQLLLRNADLRHKQEQEECFGCGLKQEGLKQCANCKLAKYCSKVSVSNLKDL